VYILVGNQAKPTQTLEKMKKEINGMQIILTGMRI